MSYDFSGKDDGIKDSGYATSILMPYCGPARFAGFRAEEIKNGKMAGTLVFNWDYDVLEDDPVYGVRKGERATLTEWPPKDDPEKIQNLINKITYHCAHLFSINSRGKGREVGERMAKEVVVLKGETLDEAWKSLGDNLTKIFDRATEQISKRDDFNIKVSGQVYNGSPRISHPGYNNFISDQFSERPLSFGANEVKGNNQYVTAIRGAASASPSSPTGGGMVGGTPPIADNDDFPDF